MTSPFYDRCARCGMVGHVAASCPRAVGHRALTADQDDCGAPPNGAPRCELPSGADRARYRAAAPAAAAALGLVGPRPDTAAARRQRALDIMQARLASQLRDTPPG